MRSNFDHFYMRKRKTSQLIPEKQFRKQVVESSLSANHLDQPRKVSVEGKT